IDAHHHLEIARQFADRGNHIALRCTLDVVEASLESVAGNLDRSRRLAESCLHRAQAASFSKYVVASAANLALFAIYSGHATKARQFLDDVLKLSTDLS